MFGCQTLVGYIKKRVFLVKMELVKLYCQKCSKEFYKKRPYCKFREKNNKPIKFCSMNCYAKWQSINNRGKNNPAYGRKRPDLTRLNKSRIGIPIKESSKRKQRAKILIWWNSEEGIKQRAELSKINRAWAKKNPQRKIEAAKNGHKSCPQVSSTEKKLSDFLKKGGIKFIPQKEYKLGFMDFFIEPNIALFVDGKYWHNYPNGTEKDRTQTRFLEACGFKVLRFWETDILRDIGLCVDKIEKNMED